MFLKTFCYNFTFLGMCFSLNAMNFLELNLVSSPLGSPTIRQTIKKPVEQQKKIIDLVDSKKPHRGTPVIICDPYGGVIGVYEDSPRSQENISELEKLQKSLKTDMIFYNSHAIANTFLLGGVFYQSSDFLGISGLYFCWCAAVYGASGLGTNKKYLEYQNLDEQNILKRLCSFQRNQACINLVAGACFLAGDFTEMPEVGYVFGGLALVAAVGNSLFFTCAS